MDDINDICAEHELALTSFPSLTPSGNAIANPTAYPCSGDHRNFPISPALPLSTLIYQPAVGKAGDGDSRKQELGATEKRCFKDGMVSLYMGRWQKRMGPPYSCHVMGLRNDGSHVRLA